MVCTYLAPGVVPCDCLENSPQRNASSSWAPFDLSVLAHWSLFRIYVGKLSSSVQLCCRPHHVLALIFGPEWLFERLLNDVETNFILFFLFSFVFVSSGALFATFDCPRDSISSNLVTTPDAKGLHLICPAIVRFAPGTMLVSSWRFVNNFDCFLGINKTSLRWQSEHLAKWSQFLAPRMQCCVYSNNQPAACNEGTNWLFKNISPILVRKELTWSELPQSWSIFCNICIHGGSTYIVCAGFWCSKGIWHLSPLWCSRCNYHKLSYRSACKQAAGTIGCLF